MAEELISIEDLAELLGVPVRTVYAWRAKGSGPRGYRIGRHVRFDRTEVQRWLDERRDPERVA